MNILSKTSKESSKQTYIAFSLLCFCFVLIYFTQSLQTHLQFFSSNMDLGFHNQLMYKWAHFRTPSSTLWNQQYDLRHCFGDHITLLMPLNSQLYWVFGSYGILVAQLLYILFGAWGLLIYVNFKTQKKELALLAVALFFTHYALTAAITFDAHDNVYGIVLLPWIMYFFDKNQATYFAIFCTLFLAARDDLAIHGTAIAFSLVLFSFRKPNQRLAVGFLLASVLYFIFAHYVVIPNLTSIPQGYAAWRFDHLGKNVPDVLWNCLKNPSQPTHLMFDNYEKKMKWAFFFLTGGYLTLLRPRYILFVLPTFFINCLSDSWSLWGNMNHYNIMFAVVLPIVIAECLADIARPKYQLLLGALFLTINIVVLFKNDLHDGSKFNRIFKSEYYHRRDNLDELNAAIALIPSNASVSASNLITAHIAFRDSAYCFPRIAAADFILLNQKDSIYSNYPIPNKADFVKAIRAVETDANFKEIFNKNGILLFKRN